MFVFFLLLNSEMQFEKAAGEVLAGLRMREANETGEMEEPTPSDVQILLTSREDPVSMRLLGVCDCLIECYLFTWRFLIFNFPHRLSTSQNW